MDIMLYFHGSSVNGYSSWASKGDKLEDDYDIMIVSSSLYDTINSKYGIGNKSPIQLNSCKRATIRGSETSLHVEELT